MSSLSFYPPRLRFNAFLGGVVWTLVALGILSLATDTTEIPTNLLALSLALVSLVAQAFWLQALCGQPLEQLNARWETVPRPRRLALALATVGLLYCLARSL